MIWWAGICVLDTGCDGAGDVLVVRWWCSGCALVVVFWCGGGGVLVRLVVFWWCAGGVHVVCLWLCLRVVMVVLC